MTTPGIRITVFNVDSLNARLVPRNYICVHMFLKVESKLGFTTTSQRKLLKLFSKLDINLRISNIYCSYI